MKCTKEKRFMFCMLAALTALGLGQAFGLFLPPKTESAAVVPAQGQVLALSGTVIFQETVVYAPEAGNWKTAVDGQRVTKGQVLFSKQNDGEEPENMARIYLLAQEARNLALPRRRKHIHEAIALAQQEEQGVEVLMAQVLGDGNLSLETKAPETSEAVHITAPAGGIFVAGVDGFEEILTPENPAGIAEAADPLALGKIITGDTWYFYTDLPYSLVPGDSLHVELCGGVFQEAVLQVVWSEASADGRWRTLFSCGEKTEAVAKIRKLTVKILR